MVNLSNLRQNKQDQQGTSGLDSSEVSALSGGGVEVFDTIDSLPSIGIDAGDKALVNSVNRLYVSDGSGWYNLDLNTGFTPRWDSGGEPDATYSIADSATPLIVTARAVDSDGTTPINQSFVSDSAQYMATISNDSSVWTFTPKTKVQIGSAVAAGNLTDSNGDFIYTFKWSDGINVLSKEVTISYNPAGGGGVMSWGGDRAITMGGYYTNAAGTGNSPNGNNGEQYITYYSISTAGTANDFGDMTTFSNKGSTSFGAASNGTRVVTIAGEEMGASFSGTDDINYYTTAVPSNTTFFGNLIVPSAGYMGAGIFAACDGTKAIMGGGWAYSSGVQYGSNQGLQQITVDTTGNATYQAPMGQQLYSAMAWNNSAQALIYGANDSQTGIDKAKIYYYTFDTTADCVSFGNINTTNANGDTVHHISTPAISGDATYMLICGGRQYDYISGSNMVRSESDEIDRVSMATTGNASAFGSLTGERRNMAAASDGTYTTLAGGATNNSNSEKASWGSGTNQIERIVVQTPGNAVDFGNLLYYHRHGIASSGAAA